MPLLGGNHHEQGNRSGQAIVGAAHKPEALAQVWLFIVAPLIGAGLAGFLFRRGGVLATEDVVPERGGGGRTVVAPAASAPRKRK